MNELTDEKIVELLESDECNPDDRGWGPKFNEFAFARAVWRAALASAPAATQGEAVVTIAQIAVFTGWKASEIYKRLGNRADQWTLNERVPAFDIINAILTAAPQPTAPARAAEATQPAAAEQSDVPNTFKLLGESDDQWLDRITGGVPSQAPAGVDPEVRNRTSAGVEAAQQGQERYKVVDGSDSGHCCFDFTVVDTATPLVIGQTVKEGRHPSVCECFDREEAQQIADALNGKKSHPQEGRMP